MFVIDTNVASELMRAEPTAVFKWVETLAVVGLPAAVPAAGTRGHRRTFGASPFGSGVGPVSLQVSSLF